MIRRHTSLPATRETGRSWETEVFILRGEDRADLWRRTCALADYLQQRPPVELIDLAFTLGTNLPAGGQRLALVAGSLDELHARLGRAAERLAEPGCRQINDSQGIYFCAEPLYPQGRLALLFPGEGAQYLNMLQDLLPHFPEVRQHFKRCDRISLQAGRRSVPISRSIFLPADAAAEEEAAAEAELARLDNAAAGVLVADWAIYQLLRRLGLRADAVAGHSSGEISALAAAGCIAADDHLMAQLFTLGHLLRQVENQGHMADAALLAVGAGRREVTPLIEQVPGEVYVAMDNCPHQAVVGGAAAAVEALEQRLRGAGIVCQRLPFNRPYHTPLFQPHLDPIVRMYQAISFGPPQTPIYSCGSGEPMPADPAEIRRLAAAQWTARVEFTTLIRRMYADGVRIFVEAGPRGNLTSFVQDILRGQTFLAVAANLQQRCGLSQLNHLVGQLVVHHVPLETAHLYRRRQPRLLPDVPVGGGCTRGTAGLPWPARHEAALGRHFGVMSDFLRLQQDMQRRYFNLAGHGRARRDSLARRERAGVRGDWQDSNKRESRSTGTSPHPGPLPKGEGTGGERRRCATASPEAVQHCLQASSGTQARPMIGEIVRHEPGRVLVMRRRVDLVEDLYARHHTLGGRNASAVAPGHHGLPVMPMAMNLEMMAEVASLLVPGKLVIGFERVRLQRWIPLYEEPILLEVTARTVLPEPRSTAAGATHVVALEIRDLGNATQPGSAESASVEGRVLLGDCYPAAPQAGDFTLCNERPCPLGPEQLYGPDRRLFHGPLFEAVCAIDRMGDEGAEGELRTLSHAELFRSTRRPELLLDPLLIDASTHVLGAWHLGQEDRSGRVVFPYELGTLQLFGPRPAEGTRLRCRVRIERTSARQVSHRIDLITLDGRLWCRLHPAEYWRFYWPPECVDFFRRHDEYLISHDWPAALPAALRAGGSAAVRYFRADDAPDVVRPVIRAAVARVALSPSEWRQFYQMQGHDRRRTEWLFGRIAAKDCIRALWQQEHGRRLFPADLEIDADAHGRPLARHRGDAAVELPSVSIAHSEGTSVAMAAFGRRVGIDLERVRPRGPGFEEIALDQQERDLLDRFAADHDRDEAVARLWCAKEAVAKALGRGLLAGPKTLAVRKFDPQTGTAHLALGPELESLFPELRSSLLVAWTSRHGDEVVATTFAETDDVA
jgi:malonyl CoA-acyl carrier protein transacylase/phosphopantetheinyl transferase